MINQIGRGGRAAVIKGKGCSRLLGDITSSFSSSFRGLRVFEPPPMSPASSTSLSLLGPSMGPFSGLVICVTGLSKEARKQVMEATERLGGKYSPHLHPGCTHLVVQSSHGRKFEHGLKHGSTIGLFLVTLGWFVDSVRRNVRLNESLYAVKGVGENIMPKGEMKGFFHSTGYEDSCLPVALLEQAKQHEMSGGRKEFTVEEESKKGSCSTLPGHSFYIDADVSADLRKKVVEVASGEGALIADQWFIGRSSTYVVCEGPSVRKYLGHSNIVTPLWVLKTAKEKRLQRLVHMSADLVRQVGMMLDGVHGGMDREDGHGKVDSRDAQISKIKVSHEENHKVATIAKNGVRKRRVRRMQTCQTPIRPISPSTLLNSLCWSISEPSSNVSVFTDSSSPEDGCESQTNLFFDANDDVKKASEAPFVNFSRPITESEKSELIFKNHFLTILFPVDRFSEMGPCSRTFFSEAGFTCLQLLDHIYEFYQDNMSAEEIEVAIHTDSRHADRLRTVYSSPEAAERGCVEFKRIDFLGSRKSFEMLKRVAGDNSSNVYELLIRA